MLSMNPDVNCEPWTIMVCQRRFIGCDKCAPLVRDADSREGGVGGWGEQGGYDDSLYFPPNFGVNL